MMLPSRRPSTRSRSISREISDPRRDRAGGSCAGGSASGGLVPEAEDGDVDDDEDPPIALAMTVTAYAGVPALIGTTLTDEEVPS
jgi:hypothetical protein